jgi:hypothetical protein
MSESIQQRVLLAADYVSQDLTNQIDRLELQLKHKKAELDAIDGNLKVASQAATRRKAFVATEGNDYLCPRCWIQNRRKIALSFKYSPGPDDIIECDACGLSV